MARIERMKTHEHPPFESQTDVVDSMSPPHSVEYVSAHHALARDCAILRLIEDDIEECRTYITRVHLRMRLLERQRDSVRRCMSLHRAQLSPLRTVPDQILQEIFQYCLPDTPYIVPDTRSAPLVLTHVCRRWRAVVQGSSEFWSSIALCDCGVWNFELEVDMVRRWLGRSRTRPIRMTITCTPRTDFGPNGHVSRSDIFQLAIAHSTHLEDLCLNVNRTYLRNFLDRADLPVLRSLVISLHSVHRIDEPLGLDLSAFNTAPNLRYITLKGDGASMNLIPQTVFSQITYLSLDCNTNLDLARLFQDFPYLEHLTLTRDAFRLQLPLQRDSRVVVPSLRSLEIYLDKDMLDFGNPEKLETLLDSLALPALHTLNIVAPLRPRFDARTGRTEARCENHAEWARSPSVASLLSRSRHSRPQYECRDVVTGGVQVNVFEVTR